MSIKLKLLPVSSLYSHMSVLMTFFRFAINTDLMLWKLKTFYPTASNSCFYHLCVFIVLANVMNSSMSCHFKGLSSLASAYLLNVVHLEHLLPDARHLCGPCVFPQYLQLFWVSLQLDFVLSCVLLFWSCLFRHQIFYNLLWLLIITLCALCDLTLLA